MTPTHEYEAEHLGLIELRIPARAEWVAVARLAVSATASRLAFSLEDIEDLKLALSEACANCCPPEGSRSSDAIDIAFEVLAEGLRVTVRDHVRHPQQQGAERPIASQLREGRTESVGIAMIHALMDEVTYRADAGMGTELVMTKRVQT